MKRALLSTAIVAGASLLCWLIIALWAAQQPTAPSVADLQAVPICFVGIGGTLVLAGFLRIPAKGSPAGQDGHDASGSGIAPAKQENTSAATEVGSAAIAVGGLTVSLLQFHSSVGAVATIGVTFGFVAAVFIILWVLSWVRDG